MIVRTADVDDAEPIARVHLKAWQEAYRGLIPQDYLDSLDLTERIETWGRILSGELTVEGLPRPADFVATRDEVVVGFANVGRFRDEPQDEGAGELWAMYVEPEFWGAGVGDVLMAATLEEFDRLGVTVSYLWALEANERALRFYQRHGWASDDVRKSFDANGVEIPEIRYSRRTP